jgi:predicted amidohydrolase
MYLLHKVIVFPELIGAFLFASASSPFSKHNSLTIGTILFLLQHFFQFVYVLAFQAKNLFRFGLFGTIRRTLLIMTAPTSWEIYQEVFSNASKKFGVYIVAGTIFTPLIKSQKLSNEGLYNTAVTFGPNGEILNIVYKTHLIPEEQSFLDSAPEQQNRVFDSPIGKVAVIVCADSWHPGVYKVYY